MRIFIIHNYYQHAGGEDAVFRQEVEHLAKQHVVTVFTNKNQKGLKGIQQFLSYPFNFSASKKILTAIDAFKPDIVHIHNLHYAIGPWIVRQITQRHIPIVQTLHNFRLLCPSASLFFRGKIFTDSLQENFPWTAVRLRVLDRSLLKTFLTAFTYWVHRKLGTWQKVSRFIVLSNFARSLFQQSTFPVAIEKFAIRPNAIDVTPRTEKRTATFLYIGRLAEEKGIIPLLNAFRELPFSITVYGAGPQQKMVELIAQEHPNIRYEGFQDQSTLTTAICQADALIVPSICYEGMPLTIIESFAQGTPVLASNIGILAEMVLPLYTGLLFDPFQTESIKKIITDWFTLDLKIKQKIAENCKTVYMQHYTLPRNIDRLIAIYNEAIQEEREKQ